MKAHGSTFVIWAALAGNGAIAATKFFAAAYTGSSAMLSEAIHSVADTGNQALLLYGTRRAAMPPDAQHPFGHGRELYFWSFVVAIVLFALGAGFSIYEGILKILEPKPMTDVRTNFIVLGIAFVFEGISAFFAYREFNRRRKGVPIFDAIRASKDPALFTVLIEDTAALLGLAVAAGGIAAAHYADLPAADGVASVAIGLTLAAAAGFLGYESKSLLIGESSRASVSADIRQTTDAQIAASGIVAGPGVMRTLQFAPSELLVILELPFKANASAAAIGDFTRTLDAEIKSRHAEVAWLYVAVTRDTSDESARDA